MKRYLVTPMPYQKPGFWKRLFIKLGLKKEPEVITFEFYMTTEFSEGDILKSVDGEYYILKQL